MKSASDQTLFSIPEFVAASIAMAVVAVIAFQGIWGSRDPNLYAANLSRPRSTSAKLQVRPWRLDDADTKAPSQTYRLSDIVTVRESESFGPGPAAGNSPGRRAGDLPASTFFVEAAPATAVEMPLPDAGGPPPPLIGPPDLFRIKNAIAPQSVKPIKEAPIPPRPDAWWITFNGIGRTSSRDTAAKSPGASTGLETRPLGSRE